MRKTVRFTPVLGDTSYAFAIIASNAPSSPDTVKLQGFGSTRTIAIPSDTGSVTFLTSDSTQAMITIISGQVAGHSITFDSFGTQPPIDVLDVPPFDTPVFYIDFDTTIPDSVTFQTSVTLTYTDAQLDSAGIDDENGLTVAWYDTTANTWNTVTGILDVANNTITFTTDHFSIWALAAVGPTSIEEENNSSISRSFALHVNHPNPFNPITNISYEVAQKTHITITVYNMLGQEVVRLINKEYTPGRYNVMWNGKNGNGNSVSSGIYLYRMTSGTGFVQSRRMLLVK